MCDCGGGVSGAQRGFGGGASAVLGAGCWEGAGMAGIVTPWQVLSVGEELSLKQLSTKAYFDQQIDTISIHIFPSR